MSSLSLSNVKKTFGDHVALKGINLEVASGSFLVLLGPSGCGKSTLLNLIAGLETISGGDIRIADRLVNDVHPKDRDVAMVFQSYALYPSMSVLKNITFGLKMRGVPRAKREEAARKAADLLHIGHLLHRRPSQLSGGQRQRVAMGRALVREPKVFLFDEPLSNLDAQLRVDMRTEIKRLHQRLGTTIVYVTHDQIEAMTMATQIAVMKDGHIVQCGTPTEIYEEPANVFVARFVGSPAMNFLPGRLREQGGRLHVDLNREGSATDPSLVLSAGRGEPLARDLAGRKVIVGIRPESIGVAHGSTPTAGGNPIVQRKIDVVEPTGADTLAIFDIAGVEVMARLRPQEAHGSGMTNFVLDPAAFHLFDGETEERIHISGAAPAESSTLRPPEAIPVARGRSQRQ